MTVRLSPPGPSYDYRRETAVQSQIEVELNRLSAAIQAAVVTYGAGTVTSVDASGGTTGLTFTGGPVTAAGTLLLGGTLAIANGGTGATTAAAARANLGAGTGNGNGSVTSVGASLTFATFSAAITTSGTLAGTWNGQAVNLVFASPTGASGAPTFRALVAADIPALNYTSAGSGGTTGLTLTGTTTLTLGGTLAIANGGTGATTAAAARTALGAGTGNGTVTSVGASLPFVTYTGSPVTTTGTLAGAWNSQLAHVVFMGPPSGLSTTPTWRTLVTADMLPNVGGLVSSNTSLSTSISNSTALTDFSLTSSIPASTVSAGDVYRIRAAGSFTTSGVAPMLTLQIKTGGAAALVIGPIVLMASANTGWEFEAELVFTTAGTTAAVEHAGKCILGTTAALAATAVMPPPVTLSRNTSAAIAIAVAAQWSLANASNAIQLRQLTVEALRQ